MLSFYERITQKMIRKDAKFKRFIERFHPGFETLYNVSVSLSMFLKIRVKYFTSSSDSLPK